MCVTTLHVSAFCVGHHQVCLEVKSYNCTEEGGRGEGRDLIMWVFLLRNALRNIGIIPLNVTVARGFSCFCLYDKNCLFYEY